MTSFGTKLRTLAALALTAEVQRRIDEVWRKSEITALRAA